VPQWCGVQSLIRELSAAVPSAEYSHLLVAWDARKLPSSTIIANDEPWNFEPNPPAPAPGGTQWMRGRPGPRRQESQGTA
jgi:hypothetical protein